jgi:nucleoside-diphosphate-sugar epimerase
MRVLIVGAAGMVGCKLARKLACDGVLGAQEIDSSSLVDAARPPTPQGVVPVEPVVCDIADPGAVRDLIRDRPEVIFNLAAVVSGEAEVDFDKGYRVNLDGTRHLLEAMRTAGDDYRPRFVFSSSIAVFGPPIPDLIGDEHATTPATSYGTQKAIAELLLADYSRHGFLDGVGIRLPTICVRPGAPNRAASGFFSGIIREPLNGQEAVLPVGREVRHWFASPRAAVRFLIHAATMDTDALGLHRSLAMPGVSATVEDEITALRRVAGDQTVALIRDEPDEMIARLVGGWPRAFDARRAAALGFVADADFDEIVSVYIEEELDTPTPAGQERR